MLMADAVEKEIWIDQAHADISTWRHKKRAH